MRNTFLILTVSAVGACSFIQDELYSPGGSAGVTMNERVFAARSVEQRADRHLAMMMFTANISSQFVETSEDAQSILIQIDATGNAIEEMYEISEKAQSCYQKIVSIQPDGGDQVSSENTSKDCPSLAGLERADARATSGIISVLGLSFYGGNGDDLVSDVLNMDVVSLASSLIDKVPSILRSTAGFRDSLLTFIEATYLACHEETPNLEDSGKVSKGKVKTDQCADLEEILASLSFGTKYVAMDAEGEKIRVYKKGLRNIRGVLKDKEYAGWSFEKSRDAMRQQVKNSCVRYQNIIKLDEREYSTTCGDFFWPASGK